MPHLLCCDESKASWSQSGPVFNLGHLSIMITSCEPESPNAQEGDVTAGKQNVRRTEQMVVLLAPGKTQREDRCSACKRLYSCELAVPCQFIRTISNERKIRSICQKVVIQILSRVGGQAWAMKFPMKSFMIAGIDVYHDTIDRKKSCLGFVASMNEFTSTRWSQTFFQQSLEEIGQKMSVCTPTAPRRYHAANGVVPQRVIVCRDGVGGGQLESVLEIESAQFFNGIKNYMRDAHAGEYEPSISKISLQNYLCVPMKKFATHFRALT